MTTTKKRVPFKWVAVGIAVVALFLAGVVSYYASAHPDGLEYVAGKTGFLDSASEHGTADGPLADYGIKGVDNRYLSTGLSGVLGVLVTFAIGAGVFRLVRRRTREPAP